MGSRRPFEVTLAELRNSQFAMRSGTSSVDVAAVVDAMLSQALSAGQRLGSSGSVTSRTLGPAGGQFGFTAGDIEGPTRKTFTWLQNCCDPCIAPKTSEAAGCPPSPIPSQPGYSGCDFC